MRLALFLSAAAVLLGGPAMAETRRKPRQDDGVRRAIAFQRAKDRADAAQARKEARNPEHFTYAAPQRNSENSLAGEQKRDALERSSESSADREAPPQR